MPDIKLSFAMMPYDRILPLINGEVKLDGITLEYAGMPGGIPRVFYNQIKFQRFDLSEMSFSSYLRLRPTGFPYIMLPVFNMRQFSYANIQIRLSSGIRQDHPEDLRGKRFGIEDYQQSRNLWTRGILETEFGIKQQEISWFQELSENFSQTGASKGAGLSLPAGLSFQYAKNDFATMYQNGELDASLGANLSKVKAANSGKADIVPLFSDPYQESIRYFKKSGVYPPHHTTVLRQSILNEHPWIAVSLMEAFEESKRMAVERLRQLPPSLLVFGELYLKNLAQTFGQDPYPYGIKANAKSIDMIQTYSLDQGLTQSKQPLAELFPQEVIYSEERK